MADWRFGEFQDDGEAWLRNPTQLYVYVDYRADSGAWRRLMVVTKTWLENQITAVRQSATEPLWAMIPTMLVLPDAEGEELRRIVDQVMQLGGFDAYSTEVSQR